MNRQITRQEAIEVIKAFEMLSSKDEIKYIVKYYRSQRLKSDRTTIGFRLIDLRGDLPRTAVALNTDLAPETVWKHEMDETKPTFSALMKYAEFYGLTLSDMLEGVVE